MRTWVRLDRSALCGYCSQLMTKGDPVLAISIAPHPPNEYGYVFDVKSARLRCETCAGEPAPAELPSGPIFKTVQGVPLPGMTRIQQLAAQLPFDAKAAAAGREPGSDDE